MKTRGVLFWLLSAAASTKGSVIRANIRKLTRELALGDFIISDPAVEVVFDDTTQANGNEIIFEYNLTGTLTYYHEVKVYDGAENGICDSSNEIASTVLGVASMLDASGDPDELTVEIDIKQDVIATSDIFSFTNDANSTARIDFCIRVSQLTPVWGTNSSINFHDTSVEVHIDLSQEVISATNITLGLNTINEVNETAQFDYDLTAFQCNGTGHEVAEDITQSSILRLCFETTSTDVGIDRIYDLTLEQVVSGGLALVAIEDGAVNEVTTSMVVPAATQNNKLWIVSTRLTGNFFDYPTGLIPKVRAMGTAILRPQDDMRRLSDGNKKALRGLAAATAQLDAIEFELELDLTHDEDETTIKSENLAAEDTDDAQYHHGLSTWKGETAAALVTLANLFV